MPPGAPLFCDGDINIIESSFSQALAILTTQATCFLPIYNSAECMHACKPGSQSVTTNDSTRCPNVNIINSVDPSLAVFELVDLGVRAEVEEKVFTLCICHRQKYEKTNQGRTRQSMEK